jgi:hypothetical protein
MMVFRPVVVRIISSGSAPNVLEHCIVCHGEMTGIESTVDHLEAPWFFSNTGVFDDLIDGWSMLIVAEIDR